MRFSFRRICVLPIRAYKLFISPLLPPACRFYPTCSDYAEQAITRYGIFKGGILALKRLCRCHPWGGQGYDPVPDTTANPRERENSRSCNPHAGK